MLAPARFGRRAGIDAASIVIASRVAGTTLNNVVSSPGPKPMVNARRLAKLSTIADGDAGHAH